MIVYNAQEINLASDPQPAKQAKSSLCDDDGTSVPFDRKAHSSKGVILGSPQDVDRPHRRIYARGGDFKLLFPPKLASDPADVSSAKERARRGQGGQNLLDCVSPNSIYRRISLLPSIIPSTFRALFI